MIWMIYALAAWKAFDIARGLYKFIREVTAKSSSSIDDFAPKF